MILYETIAILIFLSILYILSKDYIQFLKKTGTYQKGSLLEESWLIKSLKYQKPIILIWIIVILLRLFEDFFSRI
jgi:hypothetical protein